MTRHDQNSRAGAHRAVSLVIAHAAVTLPGEALRWTLARSSALIALVGKGIKAGANGERLWHCAMNAVQDEIEEDQVDTLPERPAAIGTIPRKEED